MTKSKPEQPSPLRVPKPKKLGLTVRPPLRMPHEDLIHPESMDSRVSRPSAVRSEVLSAVPTSVIPSVDSEANSTVYSAVDSKVQSTESSPVESAATIVIEAPSPVESPVISYAETPSPVASAVKSQVISYGSSPVRSAAHSPVTGQREGYVFLESTHTGAEQKVFSVMYNQTVVRGLSEQHFTVPELMAATGIRSDKTVRQALKGLEAKLSIKIVTANRSSHFGPRIKVYHPKEITDRRKKAKLIIDPKSKRILSQVDSAVNRPVESEADSTVFSAVHSSEGSSVRSSVGSSVSSFGENYRSERQNLPHIYKHNNKDANSASLQPSSVPKASDDEKLSAVKQIFERLSGGGNWKDERDLKSYQEIQHIDLYNIILGLSYSVTRSPEHKMSSLAYAVPAIIEHYNQMKLFPSDDLAKIAYETMRKTLLCMMTGKWTIPEWLAGSAE